MNERIRQLAEQAGIYKLNLSDETEYWIMEKFAELIVQECANFAYDYTSNEENVADFHDVGWDCLPGQLRSELKKHLGVEE